MIAFFFLVSVASAFTVRNQSVSFLSPGFRRLSSANIGFVRSNQSIRYEDVLAIVSSGVYVADLSLVQDPDAEFAPIEMKHKIFPGARFLSTFTFMSRDPPPHHELCNVSLIYSRSHFANCSIPLSWWFASHPDVYSVDPVPAFSLLDSTLLAGSTSTSSSLFPPFPLPGSGTIAISDIHLDPTHCAFNDPEILTIPGQTVAGAIPRGHGTATSGIACGIPCAGITGVVQATLRFISLSPSWDPDAQGVLFTPGLFPLLEGADVHSMSWGSDDEAGEYTANSALFDQHTYETGIIHTCAIGNGGRGKPGVTPCTGKSMLSAGALNPDGSIASFTSDGPLKDGRPSPILYAPGVNVMAPVSVRYPPGSPGHVNFDSFSGTSASAPYLAAVLLFEKSRRASPHYTLTDASVISTGAYRPSTLEGDVANGFAMNNSFSACLSATGDVNVTLVWGDPAAYPYANPTLINDLDMAILVENGDIYLGNSRLMTHEKVRLFLNDERFRIYVFPVSFITAPPLYFSVQATGTDIEAFECGNCKPGATLECANGTQQCYWDGTWTECSNCDIGHRLVDGQCAFDPRIPSRSLVGVVVRSASRLLSSGYLYLVLNAFFLLTN